DLYLQLLLILVSILEIYVNAS
ncbi:hypothetical protein JL09_g6462, partial [Pichia kudriavzevii]